MPGPTTFLHLTDLHIQAPQAGGLGLHSDTAAALRQTLEMISTVEPRPAFLAITGDLTNNGDKRSYELLREIVRPLDIPTIWALGNHDSREGFFAGFLGEPGRQGYYDHDTVIAGVHVITLDSSRPGMLDHEQFEWLSARLEDQLGLPKLILVHHPPMVEDDSPTEWGSLRAQDTDRLGDLLEEYNVVGILAGHIHEDRVSAWRSIPVITGTGMHFAHDPRPDGIDVKMIAGAAFGICRLHKSGLTVNFMQLPSDRRSLGVITAGQLRAYEERKRRAAN